MLGFLKALLLLPIAVVVILLAVANRAPVLVSFDPFAGGTPEIAVTMPLYGLIFATVALGIVVGGIGAWLAAGTRRRSERTSRREINRLKSEADRLRTNLVARGPALTGPGRPA